jgi:hypothetical protein
MAMKAIEKDIQRHLPKNGGYNLVGLDDFEEAGEQLYLVGNFKTKEEAEKAKKDYAKKTDDKLFVYGPDNA